MIHIFVNSWVKRLEVEGIKSLETRPGRGRKPIMDCSDEEAIRTIDRFHVQKLACDALQKMRVAHRWDAIRADNDAREEARRLGKPYTPVMLANGDTRRQLLSRGRYLLFKSADRWTESYRQRAEVLFEAYPDLKEAYSLRMIFSGNTVKAATRLSLACLYDKVEKSGFNSFSVIASTLYSHYYEVLNFFVNRATNTFAESFNAKIKAFRVSLRGVADIRFFLFRLAKLYAYPPIFVG